MKRALMAVAALMAAANVSVALALSGGQAANAKTVGSVPRYDHVFLVINENHNYNQIIGNPAAPEINALASDYGLATSYTGVGDPSEPNYVAMLGGSTFGINSDDPYFFPGHTVQASNLMSQMDAAGETWKGYFQDMPYAGFRGYCYPAKCNGIPDSDTEYVAKHNGIVNFANMQTPTEWSKQVPLQQLSTDLTSGSVPNLSYIVADECHDMHGAPPWCVDSGKAGDVDDTWLVSQGDQFVGQTVNQITSSPVWATGNNAIVVTFDEGNVASDKVATVVITNHGPRGLKDNTSYNHYSLLASLQQAFGLGCLLNSCNATAMAPLFQTTGSQGTPTLPPPFTPAPDGTDTVTPGASPAKGSPVSLSGTGWNQVPSPSIGNSDNNLTAVSAASPTDAWAVGSYYAPSNTNVLAAMAEHFDGYTWTEFPLPNVGPNENSLLGVSELPSGHAWAVGYFVNAEYQQQTLVQHYDGSTWSVIPSPSPGGRQNILYGVAALSDSDAWAVGADQDANGLWHTLTEHWDGSSWSVLNTPADSAETLTPYGVTGTDSALNVVGDRENSTAPYTTMVAAGAPNKLSLLSTPNSGSGEQDLFGATTAADGSTYAAGWSIDPSSLNHNSLIEHGVNGHWTIDATPDPGTGDNGFAAITAVPGGGLWAVGVTSNNGNFSTFIAYHS